MNAQFFVGLILGETGFRVADTAHTLAASPLVETKVRLGLTRFRGPIRVKRSGSVKGLEEDRQERQALLA